METQISPDVRERRMWTHHLVADSTEDIGHLIDNGRCLSGESSTLLCATTTEHAASLVDKTFQNHNFSCSHQVLVAFRPLYHPTGTRDIDSIYCSTLLILFLPALQDRSHEQLSGVDSEQAADDTPTLARMQAIYPSSIDQWKITGFHGLSQSPTPIDVAPASTQAKSCGSPAGAKSHPQAPPRPAQPRGRPAMRKLSPRLPADFAATAGAAMGWWAGLRRGLAVAGWALVGAGPV